jgi:hypothetical protein
MPPSAAPPSLVLLSRPLTGARFAFDDGLDEAYIGSDESCRFYLNLPQVSPVHARLWLEQDVIMVVDTQSRTGVYVNDDKVVGKGALRSGDVLWLGPPGEDTSIMLQVWVPPSSARPAPPARAPAADAADSTVVMMAAPTRPDPADSTVVMGTSPMVAADDVPEETIVATMVDLEPIHADPADSTLVMVAEEEEERPPELVETHLEVVPAFDRTLADVEEVLVEAEPEPLGETMAVEVPRFTAPPPAAPTPPPAPAPPVARAAPPPPAPRAKEEAANKTVFFQASPDAFRADLTLPDTPVPRASEPAATRTIERPQVAARPARSVTKAAPPPAVAPPAAAPVAERAAPPSPRGSTSPLVWVGLAAGLLLVAGVGAFLALRGGPAGEPPVTVAAGDVVPAPTVPSAGAQATGAVPRPAPIYEEVETVVPGARPSLAPPPTTLAAANLAAAAPAVTMAAAAPAVAPPGGTSIVSAPDLVARAESAVTAGRYDEAVGLYDQALQLDPQQGRARQGRANAAALRKSFATTPTKFIGKPKKGVPVGFEGEPPDPAYQGRISFEFVPAHVKPGDTFVVRAFLHNEGQKQIDVDNIQMLTIIDGQTGKAPAARNSKVNPGQRVLLGEHTTTWREVKAWVMEVRAVSKRKESYWSRVTWR